MEQALGVGVEGVFKQLFRARPLDDAAGIHHDHVVAGFRDDAEIVGDENGGHAHFGLEAPHQIEDLGLHGDVERGRRLVGDEQRGPAGEGDGDDDALAHAAG